MQHRRLGRSGLRVSPICIGAMMFGGPTDAATSCAMLDEAADQGVNFVDTADAYNGGKSEEVVGRAIRGRRDYWVLATIHLRRRIAPSKRPSEIKLTEFNDRAVGQFFRPMPGGVEGDGFRHCCAPPWSARCEPASSAACLAFCHPFQRYRTRPYP